MIPLRWPAALRLMRLVPAMSQSMYGRIVCVKSGHCQAEIGVFGISPDCRARMPETAHLVRAHTLCPLCNIACAPICAHLTAKSHVCGGEDVRPMKGQAILAERHFALNAISRSPFSDENAARKTIVCVMCCKRTGGTVRIRYANVPPSPRDACRLGRRH